ncbi:TonB-dependent receptor domain-containing protein [Phaeobacter porticola]|uniref:Outer membrane receptor for ferrienterochelin and colicin n=1 Tax=Phaeobacter porticola TaxID=1844006 RepID=A0A1L3IAK2_9RHOB|nr:TonB-dependent receptor [Phaeobacter porticola]APG49073.1 Outer membrane receptor for ferrienterochelin and colicin [Phaeobacter porticola]
MGQHQRGWRYWGTVSVLGLMASTGSAVAQQLDELGDDFLGTVELGQGKREVQVGIATPITVINQEEIDDRQAGTVAELIDSVPGVSLVNGNTPKGAGVNIRGFGATSSFGTDQKVAVIVDGASTGSEELYRIGTQLFTDPELYRGVSVLRGTVGSFEYGSGIIGGVVQLETKDASDFTNGEIGLRLRQTLQAVSNGSGFATSTILAWQPTDNFEFLLNYTLRDSENYDDGHGNEVTNTQSRMPSFLVKAKYSFGDAQEHALTASLNQSEVDEKDAPYDAFGTTSTSFGRVDRRIDNRVAGLRYQWSPVGNDLINLDVNLTYADQEIEQRYISGSAFCDDGGVVRNDPNCARSGPVGSPFSSATQDADHRYETTKLSIKNSMFFNTGVASHDLRAGLEIIRRDRLDASSAPGGTDDRIAVFAVDEISIGGHWTVTPALRYETQDIEAHDGSTSFDNSALMGGLSLRYEFDSGLALFGSAAYTESLPIIDDLGNATYMTQPERAHTYEIGASYAVTDVFSDNDSLSLKVNYYHSKLWDITSYTNFSPASRSFEPLDKVETEGVEIEASYSHGAGYYADLNANIADGTEHQGGRTARWRNRPADDLRLTLGKRIGQTWDLSWELAAAKPGLDASGSAVAGYGVHNLRATYRPQKGVFEGTEIRVGIENAFDRSYRPSLYSRDAAGRSVKLTLAKTF